MGVILCPLALAWADKHLSQPQTTGSNFRCSCWNSTLSPSPAVGSEGVVEDAILLGAPVDGSAKQWERMSKVVAGKIVNGYCRSVETWGGEWSKVSIWQHFARKVWCHVTVDVTLLCNHLPVCRLEGIGFSDSSTAGHRPSCVLPDYNRSAWTIGVWLTWIYPHWWVTGKLYRFTWLFTGEHNKY